MNMGFEEAPAVFRGPTQKARFWTEGWVGRELYCPGCGAESLTAYAANRPVADFHCAACAEDYELKGTKGRIGRSVPDGAYRTMLERLAASDNPNLLVMAYDPAGLAVTDLLVVPKQFFVADMIRARKPLSPTARRAGWVGCNILLGQVPDAGRIHIVRGGLPVAREAVLEKWRRTLFLRETAANARGWLIEVMKSVEAIGRPEFTLADVYAYEARLAALYPGNNNVRPKVRQQLQVLRDRGYLEFAGRGAYRLTSAG